MQFYFNPGRGNDPYALPDAEVFYMEEGVEHGYYYWACFPGCLPDSDPVGPFETQAAAIEAAQYEWEE